METKLALPPTVTLPPADARRALAGILDFTLPPELEAYEPPEARGLARDQVRLLVSYRADNRVEHTTFRAIGEFLEPGDVLVINTSGTLNAALAATRNDGTAVELHLSTHLPADLWVVEVRLPREGTTVSGRGRSLMSSPGKAAWCMAVRMSPGSTA